MSNDILLVLILLLVAIVLFVTEIFTVDKTAFFLLASTMLLGLVKPEEAISGFSEPSVITIMSLMIMAACIESNGVISLVASKMTRMATWPMWIFLPLIMIIVAICSSFIATTAVVIIFIQLTNELALQNKVDRKQMLLPISFAGILGGSCSLMGTSTNLIVSGIANRYKIEKIGFFEFSLAGIIFLVCAIPVIYFLSKIFLPKSEYKDDTEIVKSFGFITSAQIQIKSPLIGKVASKSLIWAENDYRLLRIQRQGKFIDRNLEKQNLELDDILWMNVSIDDLEKNANEMGISILNVDNTVEIMGKIDLHEILILPNSIYQGLSIDELNSEMPEGIAVKAVQSEENYLAKPILLHNLFAKRKLQVGDRVIISADEESISRLQNKNGILILNSVHPKERVPKYKKVISSLSFLMVIVLAASGTFSVLKSSLLGVSLCLFTGCFQLKDAYKSINWQVIFLLAGMIPIGIAMQNTGTDKFIAEKLNYLLEGSSTAFLITIVFGFAMLMSGFVSNNATAIVLAPIAIGVAVKMQIDPKPLLFAVMFGANFSFYTPVGYQTNAIIYGMGIYKFKHFLIIGGAVSILLWILASLLLPVLYM